MADEKLISLRQWMKEAGIDALVVPHADRFQSENLAPGDERLAWLTGFTGSAGAAIILKDKAAVFVDGRYTIQAENQIDASLFEIVQAPPVRPAQWLSQTLKPGMAVGLDPWLFTITQAKAWQNAAEDHGWTLKWLEKNPVDTVWTDKPVLEIKPAFQHALKYNGKNASEKISNVVAQLSPRAERLMMADPGLVNWLLNLRGNDVIHQPLLQAMALIDKDGHVTLFVEPKKISDKLRAALGTLSVKDFPRLEKVLTSNRKPVQLDPARTPQAVSVFCRNNDIPGHGTARD
jgi:Xaa-Pro aminopeptidase